MFRYILKRLLYAIPVFLGITFVIYTLINLRRAVRFRFLRLRVNVPE